MRFKCFGYQIASFFDIYRLLDRAYWALREHPRKGYSRENLSWFAVSPIKKKKSNLVSFENIISPFLIIMKFLVG